MSSNRDGHLTTFVLPVDEKQVENVVGAVERIDSRVAVQNVLEVDRAAALPGIFVDHRHHLRAKRKIKFRD